MLKPNIKYLAFDDRLLFYIGLPILAILLPLLFWGVSPQEFVANGWVEFAETMLFSGAFWLFSRQLMIELRKRYDSFGEIRKQFFYQLILSILLVPIVGLMVGVSVFVFYKFTGLTDPFNPTYAHALASTFFLIFALSMLYNTIYFIHKYRAAIMEKNKLELAHVQGQLDNLRNQINPHFLFNSLNTLMNLIPTDSERAMEYLSKLSKFYRYTVSTQKQPLTPLETELSNAKIYADLLHERFYKAIKINFPEAPYPEMEMLPLSLQLLIENAVKHNIVSQSKPLQVDISIDEATHYVCVKNNIQLKIEEVNSTGVGLKNIQKRMAYFTKQPVLVDDLNGQFSVAIPLLLQNQNA